MGKDPRKTWRLPGLMLIAALASAATNRSATPEVETPQKSGRSGTISWEAVTGKIEATGTQDRRIQSAIDTWRQLDGSDTASFATYAAFLRANPGWPGEDRLRGLAEKAVDLHQDGPRAIAAYFEQFPAHSARGKAIDALALARIGRMNAARAAARDAWVTGTVAPELETQLLAAFGDSFTPADNLRHADAVLWQRDVDAAARVLPSVPVTRRAVIAARIAFQRRSPDAEAEMDAADPVGVMDAGYLADKARWLSARGDHLSARKLLADRPPLAQTPADPERWYETLLKTARAAGDDGQWTLAYAIASRVDDAYPPGTDIRAQAYGERDDYTSLVWLAGTAAFEHLKHFADAEAMFTRYSNGGRSASTITKGLYWAGRAALAAGNKAQATAYFDKAGAFPEQYYGQLALERLGKAIPAPGAAEAQVALNDAERIAFDRRPIVRAAILLGQQGAWHDQSKFIRAIAAEAKTQQEHVLADELAHTIGRPDLGVMAGRRAAANGLSGYDRASFPHMDLPSDEQGNWTMIHAIARQESQFDRSIVSYAGARGLMQLMPATAREQARKSGLPYRRNQLFDPAYNVALGSGYFRRMLDYYDGSYPLAVAAYNAGPGNVNKWLRANGDPRTSDVDIVRWIEDIPIWQTKDYVKRVLENAVVYDLMNPTKDGSPPAAPLSRYLGKKTPG